MSISNSVHKISRLKHKVNIIYQCKRRTDNTTMAKRRRTDNTTMAKGKQTKGQTFNDLQNTTQKTGKKEQHKPSNNGGTLVLCM